MTNVFAYSDGTMDLVDIAARTGIGAEEAIEIADRLAEAGLMEIVDG